MRAIYYFFCTLALFFAAMLGPSEIKAQDDRPKEVIDFEKQGKEKKERTFLKRRRTPYDQTYHEQPADAKKRMRSSMKKTKKYKGHPQPSWWDRKFNTRERQMKQMRKQAKK